jgi:acyl-ACP thioesterase
VSIKADISHFFALMKYILDNIDDGQISMMASFPFVKRSAIRLSLPD